MHPPPPVNSLPAAPSADARPRRRRGVLAGAGLGAVLAAGALVVPGAAQAREACVTEAAPCTPPSSTTTSATGTVNVARGYSLTVRARPRSSAAKVRSVADGATVRIVCQRRGQSVKGPYGRSRVWDRLQGGGFVSDAYVYTGSDGRVAPACRKGPDAPPPTDTKNRPSWVPAQYWGMIKRAGAKEGLDPALLAAQLQIESAWRPTVCSEADACGLAQFLDSTWKGSWNEHRGVARGYLQPKYAIPAQARYMRRVMLPQARRADAGRIRATMDRRTDVSPAQIAAIDFNDPYQLALMGYHAGWGDSTYELWGPRTADYPTNITRQAGVR